MLKRLGGNFRHRPADLPGCLSSAGHALLEQAFAGLDREQLCDYHAHVVGCGVGDTGARINDRACSWLHPADRIKALIFMGAADVTDWNRADQQYIERLVSLLGSSGLGGRMHILAFDYHHNPDGTVNHAHSEFYTPNDYVYRLAARYPDLLVPVISVHPYRADALAELEIWRARGVRFVKWLPPAQGMDPAAGRIDPFYRFMAEHDMVLLTHVGKEMAVKARAAQELANPLRLRRPLDLGVKVIMAHCGSLGTNEDLDQPGQKAASFHLFLRMMDDPAYTERVFGELSALTQVNRLPEPLLEIMRRQDLHPRLVNGSDYPLPAVDCVIWTRSLVKLNLITRDEQKLLTEIYGYNPLLFDFVLKRSLRLPESGEKLSDCIFMANPGLAPVAVNKQNT